MRVSIEHKEVQKGMLKKTTYYDVHVAVEFTEEEQAVIKLNKVEDAVVLEREPPAGAKLTEGLEDIFHLKVRNLLKGEDTYRLTSPSDASQYDAELKDALANLKAFIEENASGPESSTFEL